MKKVRIFRAWFSQEQVKIEASGFGAQAVSHQAPSLGLALVGRYQFNEGSFDRVEAVGKAEVLWSTNTVNHGALYWF